MKIPYRSIFDVPLFFLDLYQVNKFTNFVSLWQFENSILNQTWFCCGETVTTMDRIIANAIRENVIEIG